MKKTNVRKHIRKTKSGVSPVRQHQRRIENINNNTSNLSYRQRFKKFGSSHYRLYNLTKFYDSKIEQEIIKKLSDKILEIHKKDLNTFDDAFKIVFYELYINHHNLEIENIEFNEYLKLANKYVPDNMNIFQFIPELDQNDTDFETPRNQYILKNTINQFVLENIYEEITGKYYHYYS